MKTIMNHCFSQNEDYAMTINEKSAFICIKESYIICRIYSQWRKYGINLVFKYLMFVSVVVDVIP